jgi:peroxiredoxin family protein
MKEIQKNVASNKMEKIRLANNLSKIIPKLIDTVKAAILINTNRNLFFTLVGLNNIAKEKI